jgi:hypothetical protein
MFPFKDWMLSSRRSRAGAGVTIAFVLLSTNGTAQPATTRTPAAVAKRLNSPGLLKKFMQDHIRQIDPNIDETTMFSYAFVDLNGDGKDEAIVYLTGRSWCGTGGCVTYVLTPDGESYRFVARVPATRTPIRVLDRGSHGWHSITTIVRQDATHIYEGELRFNGQKYPLGERPPAGRLPGRIVIPENPQQVPLFP